MSYHVIATVSPQVERASRLYLGAPVCLTHCSLFTYPDLAPVSALLVHRPARSIWGAIGNPRCLYRLPLPVDLPGGILIGWTMRRTGWVVQYGGEYEEEPRQFVPDKTWKVWLVATTDRYQVPYVVLEEDLYEMRSMSPRMDAGR